MSLFSDVLQISSPNCDCLFSPLMVSSDVNEIWWSSPWKIEIHFTNLMITAFSIMFNKSFSTSKSWKYSLLSSRIWDSLLFSIHISTWPALSIVKRVLSPLHCSTTVVKKLRTIGVVLSLDFQEIGLCNCGSWLSWSHKAVTFWSDAGVQSPELAVRKGRS